MKNLLAPLYFLSVSVMKNKLFVKSPLLVLFYMSMLLSCVTSNPIASAGPGPLGVGSSLQQGGGMLPFPEGKTKIRTS